MDLSLTAALTKQLAYYKAPCTEGLQQANKLGYLLEDLFAVEKGDNKEQKLDGTQL